MNGWKNIGRLEKLGERRKIIKWFHTAQVRPKLSEEEVIIIINNISIITVSRVNYLLTLNVTEFN